MARLMSASPGSAASSPSTWRCPYASSSAAEAPDAAHPACQTLCRLCQSISSASPLSAATRPS
eukprot:10759983-Alexandrium_andersonii.AAC.1